MRPRRDCALVHLRRTWRRSYVRNLRRGHGQTRIQRPNKSYRALVIENRWRPLSSSHARVTSAGFVSGAWPHATSGPAEFRFRTGRGSALGRGRNGARRVSQFRRRRRRSCCQACRSTRNQATNRSPTRSAPGRRRRERASGPTPTVDGGRRSRARAGGPRQRRSVLDRCSRGDRLQSFAASYVAFSRS